MSGLAGSSGASARRLSIRCNTSTDCEGSCPPVSSLGSGTCMGPMSLCMVKRVRRLPSSLNSGTTETVGDATRGRDLPDGGGGPANGS